MPLVRARVLLAARPLAPTFVRTIVPRRVRWHVRLDAETTARGHAKVDAPLDAAERVKEAVATHVRQIAREIVLVPQRVTAILAVSSACNTVEVIA